MYMFKFEKVKRKSNNFLLYILFYVWSWKNEKPFIKETACFIVSVISFLFVITTM